MGFSDEEPVQECVSTGSMTGAPYANRCLSGHKSGERSQEKVQPGLRQLQRVLRLQQPHRYQSAFLRVLQHRQNPRECSHQAVAHRFRRRQVCHRIMLPRVHQAMNRLLRV
ncbi:hypothetical protein ACFXTN_027698 [Malus domestica]